jgi:hypothetical protein
MYPYHYFQAIKASDNPVPDMLCLCGRIYKDKFMDSQYEDKEALNNAIKWLVHVFYFKNTYRFV